MQDYNGEKVKVTVNLTKEAAHMLYQYAGDRNRGRFLSDLIIAQRRRDEEEGARVAAEAAIEAAERSVEAARRARESRHIGGHGNGKKKR